MARPLDTRRILVVDDQSSVRVLLEAALSEAGAVVESAANGVAALYAVEARVPDLILLDLSMPELDGWAVLAQLRARPATKATPIVIQTSADDLSSFERARTEGVAAFISKPFRLAEVIETCRRVLIGASPLQGVEVRAADEPAEVLVRDTEGRLLSARLVDLDQRGAQIDMDAPLVAGRRVTLSVTEGDVVTAHAAEVRWVTRENGRFQVGLAFRS